jgi:hypothetical protein
MTDAYQQFITAKLVKCQPVGLTEIPALPNSLLPLQSALVPWALRRGRCAIFADTGLGKSRMELVWADALHAALGIDALMLTPLAVAKQMIAEAAQVGVPITLCRDASDVRPGLNVTNYERLHKFDTDRFGAVILDESSCIKHHESKTLQLLMDAFADTPYKLCCSATPAPNDWTELGSHAEFLGVCKRTEMLSEYFVHDGGETQVWRLKGHAQDAFWEWVASWAAMVRRPSDLGFDDTLYKLPPLTMHEHIVASPDTAAGLLFKADAQTLMERRNARRATIEQRVAKCAELVNAEPSESWVIWCDLNAEGDKLAAQIRDSIQVAGADHIDVKEDRLDGFATGKYLRLVSKPSIAGWGCNWQHCARMAFVGVTDSYEQFYQSIRRCYRFGQTRPVDVHVIASDIEGQVLANLRRKEADATLMAEQLSAKTRAAVMAHVFGSVSTTNEYAPTKALRIPAWLKSKE